MITHNKYVPILKCKSGEFTALTKLEPLVKEDIIPIFDLVPPLNKTLADHLEVSLNYINKWGKDRLFYVDGYMIKRQDSSLRINLMEYIFRALHREHFNALPVISNVTNQDYNAAVKKIISGRNSGLCLRIFRRPIDQVNNDIDQLLSFLELSPQSIDLVIDLRSLYLADFTSVYNSTAKILQNLKYLNNWRSLVLAGSSFPIDLVELKPDLVHPLERIEWHNWQLLHRNADLERMPAFSDYGISHPLLSKVSTDIPNASASIRYTCENDFYVYRGRGTRQKGYKQFNVLSAALIGSDEYYGVEHCKGDEYINENGTLKKKPGSLQTWRWVGTCHHLTVVVNQLRQFLRDFNEDRTS